MSYPSSQVFAGSHIRVPLAASRLIPVLMLAAVAAAFGSAHAQIVINTYFEVTVDSLVDSTFSTPGCTLRDAVASLNAGSNVDGCLRAVRTGSQPNTIVFDPMLFPGQIFLEDELAVTSPLRIVGSETLPLEISGQNQSRIFRVTDTGSLEVEHLTLQQGYTQTVGGAILSAAPVTLRHCEVNSSRADDYGGGVVATDLIVEHCTFDGNRSNLGGAIGNVGTLRVVDSVFSNNEATGSDGGGAIVIESSVAEILQSRFVSNSALAGGAILTAQSFFATTTVIASTFENNRATSGFGSSIRQLGGEALVQQSLFIDTPDSRDEWQIYQLTQSTKMQIENSTFTGNDGIAAEADITLLHVTMTLTPPQASATISLERESTTARIRDSIFTAMGNQGCRGSNANVVENRSNIFSINLCPETGPNIITSDAQLGPLQDNGGPTLSRAPLPGSPAVGAASIFCLPTDQRGFNRGNIPCDIGAVELDASSALFRDGFESP